MDTLKIPFLLNKDGSRPDEDVELAVALSLIKEGPAPKALPFLKGGDERIELAAKIFWPFLLKRSSVTNSYLLFDAMGLMGDGAEFEVNPDGVPAEVGGNLADDFINGALALAKAYAGSQPFEHNFSCLLAHKIGSALQVELLHPVGDPNGAVLPAVQVEKAQGEAEQVDTWYANLSKAADAIDATISKLNQVVEQRVVSLEEEKRRALAPLGEQLSELKPKIEEAVAAVHREESLALDGLKDQLHVQAEPWESYLASAQAGVKEYQGRIAQLADYYQRQVKLAQEEIKSLTSQQARLTTELANEYAVKAKVARRPLQRLEQQMTTASHNWEMAISREKELGAAAIEVMKKSATGRRETAEQFDLWFFSLETDNIEELILAVPFYVARYAGKTPRYLVVPPGRLQVKGQLSSLLTGMVGGTSLPFVSRADGWDDMAQMLEEALRSDLMPLVAVEAMQKANMMGTTSWQQAVAGLQKLLDQGLIKGKQAETLKAKLQHEESPVQSAPSNPDQS